MTFMGDYFMFEAFYQYLKNFDSYFCQISTAWLHKLYFAKALAKRDKL
jgi:hypothetical protein